MSCVGTTLPFLSLRGGIWWGGLDGIHGRVWKGSRLLIDLRFVLDASRDVWCIVGVG